MNKQISIFLFLLCSAIFLAQDVRPFSSPVKEVDLKDIEIITVCHDYPDHDAMFLNDKKDFVEKLKGQISSDALIMVKGEESFKSILNFVVERDGTISEIQVSGTNQKFNNAVKVAAKRIKGKWVPEKKNGNSVRSKMQIPVVMNFH